MRLLPSDHNNLTSTQTPVPSPPVGQEDATTVNSAKVSQQHVDCLSSFDILTEYQGTDSPAIRASGGS